MPPPNLSLPSHSVADNNTAVSNSIHREEKDEKDDNTEQWTIMPYIIDDRDPATRHEVWRMISVVCF